jgi:hypothetical protein
MSKTSPWYDEKKLLRVRYAHDYTGWVIDLGDGTCRYANNPLLGKDGPRWGDRVTLVPMGDGFFLADASKIIERWEEPKE